MVISIADNSCNAVLPPPSTQTDFDRLTHVLLGLLHVRYAPTWPPCTEALTAILDRHVASTWDIISSSLSDFQYGFLYNPDTRGPGNVGLLGWASSVGEVPRAEGGALGHVLPFVVEKVEEGVAGGGS